MTDDWVISFTFDVDPSTETMDLWESQLEGLDGSVARIPGRGVDVTVYASGDLSMFGTIEKMANEVTHVVQAEPIAAEILGETQWQLRGAAPTMPELMSAAEIADELKISRQRVHQLRETPSFPAPLANLRGGAVWDAEAIRRFNAEWTRTPGRPRVASTVVRVSKPVPQRRAKRISGQIAAVGKSRAKKAAARKLSPAPGMSRRSPGS